MRKYYLQISILFLLSSLLFIRCNNSIKPLSKSTLEKKPINYNPKDTFKYSIQANKGNHQKFTKPEINDYISTFLDTLNTNHYIKDDINTTQIQQELDSFYAINDHQLFWSTQEKSLPKIQVLVGELLNASAQGLNSDDYDVSKLVNLQNQVFKNSKANIFQIIELDIRLSISYLSYGWHLQNGRFTPVQIDKIWYNDTPAEPVASILATDNIREALDKVKPSNENYRQLVKALALYKAIDLNEDEKPLPANTNVRLGDSSEVVPILKKRLILTKDFSETDDDTTDSLTFDLALENAVKRFQYRHGLTADGIVGKSSVQELNVPIKARIEQIKLNLERIRWMPADFGEKYIYVNIPEYKLYVIENHKNPIQLKVIIGKEDKATPVLNDYMHYLVLSPTWTVPPKIIKNEMLPKIKSDSTYLQRNGYQLYPNWRSSAESINPDSLNLNEENTDNLKIVQKPGPGNALGRVKFVLTNSRSIYLHDTPTRYLFSRNERAFSHGCVRVEKPELLADYLLEKQDWDREKVKENMNKDEPVSVSLKKRMPVYLVYRTSWVDDKGLVNFRSDIYDADKIQLAKLRNFGNKQVAGLF